MTTIAQTSDRLKMLLRGSLLVLTYFLALLTGLLTSSTALARDMGTQTTDRFNDFRQQIDSAVQSKSNGRVLVVFDIDNTILRMTTDFGSEHWFLWQKGLIDSGLREAPAAANSIEHLLEVQGWIYSTSPMVPVDPELPQWVETLHARGADVIALTSRETSVRDATLRELRRSGIRFTSRESLGLVHQFQDSVPYNLADLSAAGFLAEEKETLSIPLARPVLFDHGVFLTKGQNKGVMLRSLLHQVSARYSSIFFIDDRPHHSLSVQKAFANRQEKVYAYHYNKSADWVRTFETSPKTGIEAAWCSFERGLRYAATPIFNTYTE